MELENPHIGLIPLREVSPDLLWEAAQDPRVWEISPAPFGRSREDLARYIREALAEEQAGRALPFAVRDLRDGKIVGSTRLADIEPLHRKAQLGYTWYMPGVWGTAVNPSCKLLLLRHAFATMGLGRIFFRINRLNTRSLAAVERLGAMREGVLRRDLLLPDGSWRDTVVLSILAEEWPRVEAKLLARLLRCDDGGER